MHAHTDRETHDVVLARVKAEFGIGLCTFFPKCRFRMQVNGVRSTICTRQLARRSGVCDSVPNFKLSAVVLYRVQ